MADKPASGELLGIPYNFEKPSLRRLLSSYWQPGDGMLVKKPFGVGYTLNLANWRSWLVVAAVAVLLWQEQSGDGADEFEAEPDDEPVEVVVED
jgi:hypothetical protein